MYQMICHEGSNKYVREKIPVSDKRVYSLTFSSSRESAGWRWWFRWGDEKRIGISAQAMLRIHHFIVPSSSQTWWLAGFSPVLFVMFQIQSRDIWDSVDESPQGVGDMSWNFRMTVWSLSLVVLISHSKHSHTHTLQVWHLSSRASWWWRILNSIFIGAFNWKINLSQGQIAACLRTWTRNGQSEIPLLLFITTAAERLRTKDDRSWTV